jgi:hypothetical protein
LIRAAQQNGCLLKELASDHFGSSFGGKTSANLMMKVAKLALKKSAG